MSVCPFCNKAAVIDPQTPCRSCGRRASEHPSTQNMGGRTIGSDGWDDEELGGDLDLSRGGSIGGGLDLSRGGPSAYSGGGLSLGDDDDPFADDAPQGALELDLPTSHTANAARSIGPAPAQSGPQSLPAGAGGAPPSGVPDLVLPAKLQVTGSTPSLPVARPPQSDPSLRPPQSDPSLRPPQSNPSLPAARPPQSDPSLRPPQSDPSLRPPESDPQVQLGVVPPSARRPADTAAAMIARFPDAPEKVWEAPAYALKVLWRQFELRQDLASLRKRRSPDVPLYERALKTHDAKTFAVGLAITCAGLALASFIFFLPVILRFLRAPD